MQVRFGEYLPHTGPLIRGQVGDQCATEIHDYQICHTKSGDQITRRLCAAALNCILEKLDPTTAYNLQAANVLLGLTPTMLSLVGNAPAELSLLAFSGRPVLAFMLNVGAPVIAVTGTFKYQHPLEVLNGSKSPFPTFHGARSVIIAFIEYILAAAAAINVGLLASDISRKAVYVPNCGRTWYAWLWMYMCLVLYPLSLFTFWSRVNIQRSTWKFWLSNETTHCASRTGICYSLKDESYLSLFLEWVSRMRRSFTPSRKPFEASRHVSGVFAPKTCLIAPIPYF